MDEGIIQLILMALLLGIPAILQGLARKKGTAARGAGGKSPGSSRGPGAEEDISRRIREMLRQATGATEEEVKPEPPKASPPPRRPAPPPAPVASEPASLVAPPREEGDRLLSSEPFADLSSIPAGPGGQSIGGDFQALDTTETPGSRLSAPRKGKRKGRTKGRRKAAVPANIGQLLRGSPRLAILGQEILGPPKAMRGD